MSETNRCCPTTPQTGGIRDIIYAYGERPLGDFIAAADKNGLCAILFGNDKCDLLDELRDAFPERGLTQACPTYGGLLANTVAKLIERPSMSPVEIKFPLRNLAHPTT